MKRKSALMSLFLAASPKKARHIFLSEKMRDDFAAIYGPAKGVADAFVLDNSFLVEPPSSIRSTSGPLTIGILSNLSVEKGILEFVALFDRLAAAGIDLMAIVAGGAADPMIRDLLRQKEATYPGRFVWRGPLYGADKAAFYDTIDCFVFPTSYVNEAQPVVLYEALAHGCCILATRQGSIAVDHAASPGAVFDHATFVVDAARWLEDLAHHLDRRDALASASVAAFAAKRAASLRTMAGLIRTMGSPG